MVVEVYTVSISDILLNAMALECVLFVDELIFETVAPVSVQKIPEELEELPLPPSRLWSGLDLRCILCAVFVAIVLLLVIVIPVADNVDTLKKVQDAVTPLRCSSVFQSWVSLPVIGSVIVCCCWQICGGHLDFVYDVGPEGVPYWSNTQASEAMNWGTQPTRTWQPADYSESTDLSWVEQAMDNVILGFGHTNYPLRQCEDIQRNLTNWGIPNECWAAQLKTPSVNLGASVSVLSASSMKPVNAIFLDNWACSDVLDDPLFLAQAISVTVYSQIADVLNHARERDNGRWHYEESSCDPVCLDRYRPLCVNNACVTPTCADLIPYCFYDAPQGALARKYCPVSVL